MRILFFIYSLQGGGAERVGSRLCNHWVESGHEVTVVTQSGIDTDGYSLLPNIRRASLGTAALSSNKVAAVLSNVNRVFRLRAQIKRIQPDVVISFMPESNVLNVLASFGLKHGTVICERTYPPSEPVPLHWGFLRKRLYRFADQCAAQTKVAADWLNTHCGCNAQVIPNASYWPLPEEQPAVNPDKLTTPAQKVLLTVARLHPEKGIDRLIEAFALIANQHKDWVLVIGGDGPHEQELRNLVKSLELTKQVIMLGRVGNVATWYQRASLVALTSHYEGFPNLLVEAMSCGTPCISVNCLAGPSDIVRHEHNGWLVDEQPGEDFEKTFSKALSEAMDNEQSLAEYGKQALACRELFGPEKVHSAWQELLRAAV